MGLGDTGTDSWGWGTRGRSPLTPVSPPGVFREAVTEFEVDARALSPAGGPHVKTRVSNPSGNVTETFVEDRGDGTYHVEYTPYEEGEGPGAPPGLWGVQGCHLRPGGDASPSPQGCTRWT